jgi:hypothetical protein
MVLLGVCGSILSALEFKRTFYNTDIFFGLTGEPASCLSVVDISMALNDATVEALPL